MATSTHELNNRYKDTIIKDYQHLEDNYADLSAKHQQVLKDLNEKNNKIEELSSIIDNIPSQIEEAKLNYGNEIMKSNEENVSKLHCEYKQAVELFLDELRPLFDNKSYNLKEKLEADIAKLETQLNFKKELLEELSGSNIPATNKVLEVEILETQEQAMLDDPEVEAINTVPVFEPQPAPNPVFEEAVEESSSIEQLSNFGQNTQY